MAYILTRKHYITKYNFVNMMFPNTRFLADLRCIFFFFLPTAVQGSIETEEEKYSLT